MSVEALAALLARRLDEADRAGDASISVAELHRTLLPYHICRGSVGYATKAEYDIEMLELLSSDRYLFPAENELRSAVRDETASPEPGLGFLKNFSAAQLEIRSDLSTVLDTSPSTLTVETPERGSTSEPAMPSEPPAAEATGAPDKDLRARGACWKCSRELPPRPGLRFCVFCGVDQDRPCCLACGEEMTAGWAFCPKCGKGVSAASTSST
jgi:hypothetical protein